MRAVKALKSMRYADSKPHLPTRELLAGVVYTSDDVSDYIMDNAIRIGFAEELEIDANGMIEPERETKVIEPEPKEKTAKKKKRK